jgi:TorA maturation chaperone TorD
MARAVFYELLAKSFLYPAASLAEAVANGDYAEAAGEVCIALGEEGGPLGDGALGDALEGLAVYGGRDHDALLHELRIEHTRLFIGAPGPVISPYGGIWRAQRYGAAPVLFVSNEALAVEQAMRSAGIGNPQGSKEPLDHIGSELEFAQYLCLVLAGAERPHEKAELSEAGYREFVSKHIKSWNRDFADAVLAQSESPFFQAAARLLMHVQQVSVL